MSYRIHISVMNKKDYLIYLKKYKKSKDEDKYFYIDNSIEISDDTDIRQFKKIPIKKLEYHPRILNKKDFKKIIIFYQNEQLSISEKRLKDIEIIKEQYSKEDKLNKVNQQAVDSINRFQTELHYTLWYFEKLQRDNILIADSDYFKLQYFYMVGLYESFSDKENVLILTHG